MLFILRRIFAGKLFQQVGDAVQVLPIGESGEFDARRFFAARFAGVKSTVDVFGDGCGLFGRNAAGIIVWHVSFDIARQPWERTISLQAVLVFAFYAFAVAAMAFGAVIAKNVFAGIRGGCMDA